MKIFVLTGAGVSAESGVATFRDPDGIWARYAIEDVATPQAFARDPGLVHAFYNARRAALPNVAPNPAHRALAELETGLEARGGRMFLCTQNVDDLHERGGSRRVVHMHGELAKVRCENCGDRRVRLEELSVRTPCPACATPGFLRPDVVWFGETPMHMEAIYEALLDADLFVSIGTSGAVYPAAGFVREARLAGIETMEINLEPSDNARVFDRADYGPAGERVPAWVRSVLEA